MPGLFGILEKISTGRISDHGQNALERLRHFHFYKQDQATRGNFFAGISLPYELDGTGVYFEEKKGLLVGFDGYLEYYTDENGGKHPVKSDRYFEVLVGLYEQHGNRMVDYLCGSYNTAIYDIKKSRLIIFNDIMGHRLLYYWDDDRAFIFGPELKAFPSHPYFNKKLNEHAVSDIFNFGRIWGDKTLLEGVKNLPPAGIIEIAGGKAEKRIYFVDVHSEQYKDASLEELVDTGWRLLNVSMDRSLEKKTSVAVPLSGGKDSRLLLNLVKTRNVDHAAYTIADSPSCLEYKIAKKVVERIGTVNHFLMEVGPEKSARHFNTAVWLCDGSHINAGIVILPVAKRMNENHDGLINGIFGGHLSFSAGYYYPEYDQNEGDSAKRFQIFSSIVRSRNRPLATGPPPARPFRPDYAAFLHEAALQSAREQFDESSQYTNNIAELVLIYLRRAYLRRQQNIVDVHRLLTRSECVFASGDLFRYHLGIPMKRKMGNVIYYGMFRKFAPHLVSLPTIQTEERAVRKSLDVPPSPRVEKLLSYKDRLAYYMTRLSSGKFNYSDPFFYVHPNQWFRDSRIFRDEIKRIALDERTFSRPYIDRAEIMSLITRQENGGDSIDTILRIVQVELFLRMFFENEVPEIRYDSL